MGYDELGKMCDKMHSLYSCGKRSSVYRLIPIRGSLKPIYCLYEPLMNQVRALRGKLLSYDTVIVPGAEKLWR